MKIRRLIVAKSVNRTVSEHGGQEHLLSMFSILGKTPDHLQNLSGQVPDDGIKRIDIELIVLVCRCLRL